MGVPSSFEYSELGVEGSGLLPVSFQHYGCKVEHQVIYVMWLDRQLPTQLLKTVADSP